MHGARGAVYAREEVRGGREVRPQGPEALPDEESRGYVSPRSPQHPSPTGAPSGTSPLACTVHVSAVPAQQAHFALAMYIQAK